MSLGGAWKNILHLTICYELSQHLAEWIQEGVFDTTIQDDIQNMVKMLSLIFGEEMIVTDVSTYKTPLSQWFWSDLLLYHQYAIIKVKASTHHFIYWSFEKNMEGLWLSAFDNFESCKDLKIVDPVQKKIDLRCKTNYWHPEMLKNNIKPTQESNNFYEMIRWIFTEKENQNSYNLFKANCQIFCDRIYSRFTY